MSIRDNNKHRYEYLYEMNKEMYIRIAGKPSKHINDLKSYGEKYCYLRAEMDLLGIVYVLNGHIHDKKLHSMIWLAWGHKSRLINYVGVGDFTYPKNNG